MIVLPTIYTLLAITAFGCLSAGFAFGYMFASRDTSDDAVV